MSYLDGKNMKFLYALAGVLFVIDAAGYFLHLTESFPGFWAVFGFAGCVILIYFSKFIGRFITKKEDYYDRFRKVG